jgi:hypothetical protein
MHLRFRGILLGSALLVAGSAIFYAQQKILPAPFATPSVNNRRRLSLLPRGAQLKTPAVSRGDLQEGFKQPRFMLLGPSNEILLTTPAAETAAVRRALYMSSTARSASRWSRT